MRIFFCSVLKQMPMFPMIHSVLNKGFVVGTWDKIPAGCAQQIGEGWWYDSSITQCAVSSNLNGIYPRCGKETLAAIHWGYLGRSAKRSAPTSTEMKIRPVEFMRVA